MKFESCFFEYDERNNVLCCTWNGVITDEAFRASVAKVRRFLASHIGSRSINDFSRVTKFEVSNETLRAVAWEKPRGEEASVVVFVTPQDWAFGLARMFSVLTETTRPNRHVVRTTEEAYKLLGIKDLQFTNLEPT